MKASRCGNERQERSDRRKASSEVEVDKRLIALLLLTAAAVKTRGPTHEVSLLAKLTIF